MEVTILTEPEIRQCVEMDQEAIAVVEDGFTRLANAEVTLPPIVRVDIPEHKGEVDVKTAHVRGLDSFAIKIASGFFENYRLGLPTGSGMMVIVSARTGIPEAVLLDNGYLTDVRTGAAGAVAARYLARMKIDTAGVIGSGTQARYQMMALKLVRDFRRLMVYGIVPDQVEQYAAEMAPVLGVEIVKAKDAETVVRNSDVVVTATPSREPYLKAEWLHPGLHVTAMGADSEEKQELHADVLGRADLLVCDRKSQCFRLGELHHGLEAGIISQDDPIVELGDLTSGRKPGRRSDEQITICDLTGVGVQDTAIALLAYRKAMEKNLGLRI
ncbi:MAG: cyclodeaminase [Anaerolineae bacterium]